MGVSAPLSTDTYVPIDFLKKILAYFLRKGARRPRQFVARRTRRAGRMPPAAKGALPLWNPRQEKPE